MTLFQLRNHLFIRVTINGSTRDKSPLITCFYGLRKSYAKPLMGTPPPNLIVSNEIRKSIAP